jgi:hypothetical protein
VGPHPVVHRGNEKNLRLSGEKAGRQEIISQTVRSAAHEVRCGGRNDDDVRFAREPDVIQGVTGPKNLGMHRPACNRLERDPADELPCRASHHNIDLSACLCKQTRQPH